MNTQTHLEDFSNEIFFEIFDYLHALDIFIAFTSLNKRISSILQSIPLHIFISRIHSRNEIDFLSSYLTFQAHQVISITICDVIRDDTSIISLLFNRHDFINLQFCRFTTIHPLTKLENVIKQIKTYDKLVSFDISNRNDESMNEIDKYELARTMLMHKSSSLRSIVLWYAYDYSSISNNISLPSNVTSLYLYISGPSSSVSVHSILPILRLCHRLCKIGILLKDSSPIDNTDAYVPMTIPFINENNLPVLSQVISFELILYAPWDNHSIAYVLRCMPNLRYFFLIFWPYSSKQFSPMELLDGYVWQDMLERYVPHLSKFEFSMSIYKFYPLINLDSVVDSFEHFVNKYSNWHMIIDQWIVQSSTPVSFHQTSDDDVQETVTCLSNFVHFHNIIEIEFGSSFNIYRWKHAQFILQACPNVLNLTMLTALLIYSKFIDNPSLIPVFRQIELIETTLEDVYFPPSFASKLVERFPSLIHIELQVVSFNSSVSIVDTLLSHLRNLSYLKIDYFEDSSVDDPFSRQKIIEKRRQAFPMNIINEQLVNVKNDGGVIEIWLT